MMGRAVRLVAVLTIAVATWFLAGLLITGPHRAATSTYAFAGETVPANCAEVDPAWSEASIDFEANGSPVAPGRVFRLSDGTIAVLLVVTAANGDGLPTAFDFSASIRVSAVIVRAGNDGALIRFDPPARNGTGLAVPDQRGIDGVSFCYRVQVPNPPEPGATVEPEESPTVEASPPNVSVTATATATSTPETFDIGAVQTASALATTVAAAQATADAASTAAAGSEATRVAEAAAAEATIAALGTAAAAQNATAAAESTAVAATASAEVASAQSTTEALATAEAARQTDLATAQAVQTEAAATIAALQVPSETPTPTETSVPTETPLPAATETLYYGVPETEGFDAWAASLPPGWTVSDSQLSSDGSGFQGYVQPPRTVNRDDYAVEAEIRVVEEPACNANLGIVVRGSETGFYAGGIEWVCNAGPSVRLWALNSLLVQQNQTIDQEWHTYRIAVAGDQITLSIDGVTVLQTTDASFPTGGQIALWSNGVQLEVRAFRVYVAS